MDLVISSFGQLEILSDFRLIEIFTMRVSCFAFSYRIVSCTSFEGRNPRLLFNSAQSMMIPRMTWSRRALLFLIMPPVVIFDRKQGASQIYRRDACRCLPLFVPENSHLDRNNKRNLLLFQSATNNRGNLHYHRYISHRCPDKKAGKDAFIPFGDQAIGFSRFHAVANIKIGFACCLMRTPSNFRRARMSVQPTGRHTTASNLRRRRSAVFKDN